MGLDSVEIIMKAEKYFRISIPDAEAEKAITVQNFVDVIAQHLHLESADTSLRDKIFSDVSSCIQRIAGLNTQISLTDKITNYLIVDDKETWSRFEALLMLKVPHPSSYDPHSDKFIDRFRKLVRWTPNYDWQTISVMQFVDAICANNYDKLLDPENIKSKHEIYIAVMGITVDQIGVDYFEILPEKSFVTDLGVD